MGCIRFSVHTGLRVILACSLIGAAFQAPPNLTLYWKLEETAGPTAVDSSTSGINGTWAGTAGLVAVSTDFAPHTPGNTRSLLFTKPATVLTAGGYVRSTTSAPTRFTGPFSMMAWIRPTTLASGQNANNTGAVLYNWNYVSPNFNGYGFHRNMSGVIHFYTGTTTAMSTVTSTGTAPDNAWTHVACVYTGTQKIIYINGAANTTAASTLNPGATTANFQIGKDDSNRNFYGNIDEVRLFNNALTAAEINAYYTGVFPPTGLTATNGINAVTLNWGAVAGATSYTILRSGTAGGPYTQVSSVTAPTTTFTNTGVTNPNTYYYVVRTVITGVSSGNSIEVVGRPLPPQVTALPNTGLQTNENLATTTFSVKFNVAAPAAGSVVTVLSNDTSEGVVSTTFAGATPIGTGFSVSVASGQMPTIPVVVTGRDDTLVDGAIPYSVSVTATNMGVTIPNVNLTNNDNDSPGITFSRTSGLVTTEAGGTDFFTVSLNTQPFGSITMSLASNLTTEGTVSPTSITFNGTNWNSAQQVTLTGVGDAAIDFSIPYTIVSGNLVAPNVNDASYNGLKPPDVSAVNLDDEVIPAAPAAWGGCGLLGLELGLVLVLAALRRRIA